MKLVELSKFVDTAHSFSFPEDAQSLYRIRHRSGGSDYWLDNGYGEYLIENLTTGDTINRVLRDSLDVIAVIDKDESGTRLTRLSELFSSELRNRNALEIRIDLPRTSQLTVLNRLLIWLGK